MEGTRTRMIEYFDNLPRIESNDLSTFTSALPRFPNLAILLYLSAAEVALRFGEQHMLLWLRRAA
jgi:hypothetical protein